MALYLSIPILDELVRCVEDNSTSKDSVKAMASGILNYYFPATTGYTVAPKQTQNNYTHADFIILRIQHRIQGDRGTTRTVINHTVANAKPTSASLETSLEEFERALEHADTGDRGRCWDQ